MSIKLKTKADYAWPIILDKVDAEDACLYGFWISAWVAVSSGIGWIFSQMPPMSETYVSSILFSILGYGFIKGSRLITVAGTALVVAGIAIDTYSTGQNAPQYLILIFCLLVGLRGVFSRHE